MTLTETVKISISRTRSMSFEDSGPKKHHPTEADRWTCEDAPAHDDSHSITPADDPDTVRTEAPAVRRNLPHPERIVDRS